jgi:hypothetical protein
VESHGHREDILEAIHVKLANGGALANSWMQGHSQHRDYKFLSPVAHGDAAAKKGSEPVKIGLDWNIVMWILTINMFKRESRVVQGSCQ